MITQPDRPVGRGHNCRCRRSSAWRWSGAAGLPVPSACAGRRGLDLLRALKPDLMVTAAFGQILSPEDFGYPAAGGHQCMPAAARLPGLRAHPVGDLYHGERRPG